MTDIITPNFSFLTDYIFNTNFFGLTGLVGLIVVIFTMLMITFDLQKWRTLLLPIATMWHIVGIKQNILILIIGVIIFVQENLSPELVGNILDMTEKVTSNIYRGISKTTNYVTDRENYNLNKQYNKLKREDEAWNKKNEKIDYINESLKKSSIQGILDNLINKPIDNTISNDILKNTKQTNKKKDMNTLISDMLEKEKRINELRKKYNFD